MEQQIRTSLSYDKLVQILKENVDEKYRAFQKRLVFTNAEILGVRMPILRKIAKSLRGMDELFFFPDEYFEITFLKMVLASELPFEKLVEKLDILVPAIDNWSICDTFKAKCLKNHKDEFLPYIDKYFKDGKEFSLRFALVNLLTFYTDKKYFPLIKDYLSRVNTEKYYVHMAAAWLVAEILIKNYDGGVALLTSYILDKKTHNKGIQKAIESYRLTKQQKEYLRTLKIK